jgi:hypothetical protein
MTDQEKIELADSLIEKDWLLVDAYQKLLKFFVVNSEVLSNYQISFDGVPSLDEAKNSNVDEEKKEADVILKFADKYDQYFSVLEKYRARLAPEKLKAVEKDVSFASKTGKSVEQRYL